MAIPEARFWRMTLAEWRAALAGYRRRVRDERMERAWVLSWQLVAAGAKPDEVTPRKLLGIKERAKDEEPKLTPEEIVAILLENRQSQEVTRGEN